MSNLLGFNEDILTQAQLLEYIVLQNKPLKTVLNRISEIGDDTMYLASGSIAQTVWNYQTNMPLMIGISDFDIIYFDEDTSYEAEDKVIKLVESLTKDIEFEVDVKNQARVHLWIPEKWNREIKPYTSSEDAISSWSSTASCIGLQFKNNKLKIFAPYGLNDIFGQIMKPNRDKVFRELYDYKVEKWTKKWNFLNVIPW